MEEMSHSSKSSERRCSLSNAERKARYRAKQKAIQEGTFYSSLIEEAKFELKKMEEMNLAALLLMQKFKDAFDDEEMQVLKNFIFNQKKKDKKLSKETLKTQQ